MYFTLNNIEESFQFLLPFLLFGDKQWINKYGAQEGSRWQNMRWSMQELERKKKKKKLHESFCLPLFCSYFYCNDSYLFDSRGILLMVMVNNFSKVYIPLWLLMPVLSQQQAKWGHRKTFFYCQLELKKKKKHLVIEKGQSFN